MRVYILEGFRKTDGQTHGYTVGIYSTDELARKAKEFYMADLIRFPKNGHELFFHICYQQVDEPLLSDNDLETAAQTMGRFIELAENHN